MDEVERLMYIYNTALEELIFRFTYADKSEIGYIAKKIDFLMKHYKTISGLLSHAKWYYTYKAKQNDNLLEYYKTDLTALMAVLTDYYPAYLGDPIAQLQRFEHFLKYIMNITDTETRDELMKTIMLVVRSFIKSMRLPEPIKMILDKVVEKYITKVIPSQEEKKGDQSTLTNKKTE
ncbi:hypothetical protein SBV1_gp02 [Sulfolobales Beppu virus 1]|nr:hypothetical protein SBV1_gp02 [Sulfolobales Beppu virus 1]